LTSKRIDELKLGYPRIAPGKDARGIFATIGRHVGLTPGLPCRAYKKDGRFWE